MNFITYRSEPMVDNRISQTFYKERGLSKTMDMCGVFNVVYTTERKSPVRFEGQEPAILGSSITFVSIEGKHMDGFYYKTSEKENFLKDEKRLKKAFPRLNHYHKE